MAGFGFACPPSRSSLFSASFEDKPPVTYSASKNGSICSSLRRSNPFPLPASVYPAILIPASCSSRSVSYTPGSSRSFCFRTDANACSAGAKTIRSCSSDAPAYRCLTDGSSAAANGCSTSPYAVCTCLNSRSTVSRGSPSIRAVSPAIA